MKKLFQKFASHLVSLKFQKIKSFILLISFHLVFTLLYTLQKLTIAAIKSTVHLGRMSAPNFVIFAEIQKYRLICILWKSFSLPTTEKKISLYDQKLSPWHAFLSNYTCTQDDSAEMGWFKFNCVYSDLTFVKYGYFCIFVRFLLLMQVSQVIMIRCSKNLLCLPSVKYIFVRICGTERGK